MRLVTGNAGNTKSQLCGYFLVLPLFYLLQKVVVM